MIKVKVGDRVVYRSHSTARPEAGEVTELVPAHRAARVRYDGEYTAKLTPLDRLEKIR